MSVPRPEYPRPQFVRPDWLCLNGDLAVRDRRRRQRPGAWSARARAGRQHHACRSAPSRAVGRRQRRLHGRVWYRRDGHASRPSGRAASVLLHFQAPSTTTPRCGSTAWRSAATAAASALHLRPGRRRGARRRSHHRRARARRQARPQPRGKQSRPVRQQRRSTIPAPPASGRPSGWSRCRTHRAAQRRASRPMWPTACSAWSSR